MRERFAVNENGTRTETEEAVLGTKLRLLRETYIGGLATDH